MDNQLISDRAAAGKFIIAGALLALTAWSSTLEQVQKLTEQLTKLGIPPQAAPWAIASALALAAGYFLIQSLAQRSRLVQPERFRLNPDDRAHLKGRLDDVERLATLCERHPLVFLDGESGSGKSALLRAGLIPYLVEPRALVLHCDLSGARWEDGLAGILAQALARSLNEDQRKKLGWQSMPTAQTVFAEIAKLQSVLGRKPLLAFDQFDDYQNAHRDRFFREGSGELRSMADFLAGNRFWTAVQEGLQLDQWHVLFITRSDQRAGLDLVRFAEPGSLTLRRVSRNKIAPVLDDIATVGKDERPTIVNPDRGWNLLRERLLDDLRDPDSGDVLPIQLAIALQGMQELKFLTIGEYTRVGGADGLACLQVKREVRHASRDCQLDSDRVLAALVALTDAERRKSRRLREQELTTILLGAAPQAAQTKNEVQRARNALLQLRDRHVLRTGVDGQEADDQAGDWLLYHDYLVRGIVAAHREQDRWQLDLRDRQKRYQGASRWRDRWQELLPIALQARLAWERWRPSLQSQRANRFRYGAGRRYAALSVLKPAVLAAVLVASTVTISQGYQQAQDRLAVDALFDTLRGEEQLNSKELDALEAVEHRGRHAATLALVRVFRKASLTDPNGSGSIDQKVAEFRPALDRMVHRVLGVDDRAQRSRELLSQLDVAVAPAVATNGQLKLLARLVAMIPAETARVSGPSVAQEICHRMADKAAGSNEVDMLRTALVGLTSKLSDGAVINNVAQALVERMTDQTTESGEVAVLGTALASLTTKLTDAKVVDNGAHALMERMTDQTTNSVEADRLGLALAGLAPNLSDAAVVNNAGQALVERMSDKTTDSGEVARLGMALAGLTAKLSNAAVVDKGARALMERMADKATDTVEVADLGSALFGLRTKVSDAAVVNIAAQALAERMADKATTSDGFVSLGEALAGLTTNRSDTAVVEKGARALIERMADTVSDRVDRARLGLVLASLTDNIDDAAVFNKVAQMIVERIADKATGSVAVAHLGSVLAGLTTKLSDQAVINNGARAVVERISDSANGGIAFRSLCSALAALTTKLSDEALINKAAQALLEGALEKSVIVHDAAGSASALDGLTAKLSDATMVNKLALALAKRMSDKATNSIEIDSLGPALAAVTAKVSDAAVVNKVAQALVERMLDKTTYFLEVESLESALASVTAKLNNAAVVNKVAQALVERMADKATDSGGVARLGEALAVLTTKLNDAALVDKGVRAMMERMTDQTTDSDEAARLGLALAGLAPNFSDAAVVNNAGQALVERMANKATGSGGVARLGEALAGLTAKLSNAAVVDKGARALMERMADKGIDSAGAARLGEALAGLTAKLNDAAVVDKGSQALVERIADKAIDDNELGRLCRLSIELAQHSQLDRRNALALQLLHAAVSRRDWFLDGGTSQEVSLMFSRVPEQELAIALASPMGASDPGRETLLRALRIKLSLSDSDDYWAVIGALRKAHPEAFAGLSN